jgi:hypothetical protein
MRAQNYGVPQPERDRDALSKCSDAGGKIAVSTRKAMASSDRRGALAALIALETRPLLTHDALGTGKAAGIGLDLLALKRNDHGAGR